jgi:hypothetical protein
VSQKIDGTPTWDPSTGQWSGSGVGSPVVNVSAYGGTYSSEINSGGGLVYGYNWNAKTAATGTYRLTFVLDGNSGVGPRCTTTLATEFQSGVTKLVNVGENNPGADAQGWRQQGWRRQGWWRQVRRHGDDEPIVVTEAQQQMAGEMSCRHPRPYFRRCAPAQAMAGRRPRRQTGAAANRRGSKQARQQTGAAANRRARRRNVHDAIAPRCCMSLRLRQGESGRIRHFPDAPSCSQAAFAPSSRRCSPAAPSTFRRCAS